MTNDNHDIDKEFNKLGEVTKASTIQDRADTYISELFGTKAGLRLLMTAYVKDHPETVMYYQSIVADVMNFHNCGKTTAITKMLILAAEIYHRFMDEMNGLSQETRDAVEAFDLDIEESIHVMRVKHVKKLFERGETQKAIDQCDRYGLDFDTVISEYTLPINNADKSPVIREWLKNYFLDHDQAQVSRIKSDMLDDGIIDLADWSLVKNIASSEGYSGKTQRGIWQRKY